MFKKYYSSWSKKKGKSESKNFDTQKGKRIVKIVEEAVLEAHNELLDELGKNERSTPDAKMSRGLGIDSLGIVTLILSVEEKLDITLDEYLADIRSSYYVRDFIEIVEKAYLEQNANSGQTVRPFRNKRCSYSDVTVHLF